MTEKTKNKHKGNGKLALVIERNYYKCQFLCIGAIARIRGSMGYIRREQTCTQEREDIAAVKICVGECAVKE